MKEHPDANDTARLEGADGVRRRHDQAQTLNGSANGKDHPPVKRLIQSSAEFVAGFTPPEYVIDGILQRGFLYALTGQTGSGKTAILLRWAAHVALGRPIADRAVEKGRALYFAGENHVDIQMRWIAMAEQLDEDIDDIDVCFIPGQIKISDMKERIAAEVRETGEMTLVVIDTATAYFEGDDENKNPQALAHARLLRGLTELPGRPCVVAACHPTKNAGADNLLPRGGGAFLAEIDGNLTAQKNDIVIEVHTQGKFRGPDFAPLTFQLRTVTHQCLVDSKGRRIPTVIAQQLSEIAEQDMQIVARAQDEALLKVVAKHPSASHTELAKLLDWKMRDGRPYKVLVRRRLLVMTKAKLIDKEGSTNVLTKKGEKALAKTNGAGGGPQSGAEA